MGRVFVDSCEKLNKISLGALAQRGIVCVFGPGTATGGGDAVVAHCVLYFQTPYSRQPELLLAVGFLASSLVTPQSADSIVLCAKGHVGEVLAVFEVKVIALVAVRTVVA